MVFQTIQYVHRYIQRITDWDISFSTSVAASAVASWDRQIETSRSECSLASLWQMVSVINGFITEGCKNLIAHS